MWKLLRRSIGALFVLALLAVVLRGPLYRIIVRYEVIDARGGTDPIPSSLPPRDARAFDLDQLIDDALDTTAYRLHFSTSQVPQKAALMINGSAANCIGYAALFKALLEQELLRSGHADDYLVEQVVGQLHIGQWNVHRALDDPFWKDHDIVRITERRSGLRHYVDPTLFDAIGVSRISGP